MKYGKRDVRRQRRQQVLLKGGNGKPLSHSGGQMSSIQDWAIGKVAVGSEGDKGYFILAKIRAAPCSADATCGSKRANPHVRRALAVSLYFLYFELFAWLIVLV